MKRQRLPLSFLGLGLGMTLGMSLWGCVSAPPTDRAGLPRVSRYTTNTQIDWMLERYAALAARSQDPVLVQRACLGWERTVFDLQSFSQYPVILRQSSDSAGLEFAAADLWRVVERHPLPAACKGGAARPEQGAQDAQATQADAPAQAGQAAQGAAAPDGNAQAALENAAAAPAGGTGGAREEGLPRTATAPVSAEAQSEAGAERAQLARLRQVLGLAATESGRLRADIDQAALSALAKSEIPTIRLRARFHQLGQCVLLNEAADRFNQAGGACPEGRPGEDLRRAEARLRTSMILALRAKYVEPMGDIATALVAYTSRDFPAVPSPSPSLR
jgi:hypothetical protein